VAANNSLGKIAENFVRNRDGPTGVIDGGNSFRAAVSEQDNFVPNLSLRDVSDVNDGEVHRDAA